MRASQLLRVSLTSASSIARTCSKQASSATKAVKCTSSLCSTVGAVSSSPSGFLKSTPMRRIQFKEENEDEKTERQHTRSKFEIVQFPARSLWERQLEVDLDDLKTGKLNKLIQNLKDARQYYQYPSMSAPQIGWNARVFVLNDNSVYVNPEILESSEVDPTQTNFAWEPCASCCFAMHYIERQQKVAIRSLNEHGDEFEKVLEKYESRMVQHEMDHLDGVLFTRRIPNTDHVVPMDSFFMMSDWPSDFPSAEARSTYLYNLFTPPHHFEACSVPDANLFDRMYSDRVFPGSDAVDELNDVALAQLDEKRKHEIRSKGSHASQHGTVEESTMDEVDDFLDGEVDGTTSDGEESTLNTAEAAKALEQEVEDNLKE